MACMSTIRFWGSTSMGMPSTPAFTGLTTGDFAEMDAEGFPWTLPSRRPGPGPGAPGKRCSSSEERRQVREVEYRFRTAGGDWIWCLSRDSRLKRSGDQRPVLVGSFPGHHGEEDHRGGSLKAGPEEAERDPNALLERPFFTSARGAGGPEPFLGPGPAIPAESTNAWPQMNRAPPLGPHRPPPRRALPGNPGPCRHPGSGGRRSSPRPGSHGWMWLRSRERRRPQGPASGNESFYPIRLEGEVLGLAGIVEDITEQRSARGGAGGSCCRTPGGPIAGRTSFLAVLGHELRDSLAALRNGLAVTERSWPATMRGKQVREMIGRQLAHLVPPWWTIAGPLRVEPGEDRAEERAGGAGRGGGGGRPAGASLHSAPGAPAGAPGIPHAAPRDGRLRASGAVSWETCCQLRRQVRHEGVRSPSSVETGMVGSEVRVRDRASASSRRR